MAELKREYVVPLRRKTRFAPKWRRSKKAVSVLNDFIKKHMKSEDIIICKELNEKIWENGIKNPPGKVNVIALKTDINGSEKTLVNLVEAGIDKQLEAYKKELPKEEAKAEEKTETKEEVKDAEVKEVPKKETKKEEKPSAKKTEEKKVEKKEAKK